MRRAGFRKVPRRMVVKTGETSTVDAKSRFGKILGGHDVTADEATAMFQGEEIGPVEITLKSGMKKEGEDEI